MCGSYNISNVVYGDLGVCVCDLAVESFIVCFRYVESPARFAVLGC